MTIHLSPRHFDGGAVFLRSVSLCLCRPGFLNHSPLWISGSPAAMACPSHFSDNILRILGAPKIPPDTARIPPRWSVSPNFYTLAISQTVAKLPPADKMGGIFWSYGNFFLTRWVGEMVGKQNGNAPQLNSTQQLNIERDHMHEREITCMIAFFEIFIKNRYSISLPFCDARDFVHRPSRASRIKKTTTSPGIEPGESALKVDTLNTVLTGCCDLVS